MRFGSTRGSELFSETSGSDENPVSGLWADNVEDKNLRSQEVLEVYKMYVEMADRVSQRRQSANSFYLSINTIFVGGMSFLSLENLVTFEVCLLSISGILLCIFWLRNIHSYKDLNSGKFAVINSIEERLAVKPYTAEWDFLDRGKKHKKYRPFHKVEALVPILFILLYLAKLLFYPNWSSLF